MKTTLISIIFALTSTLAFSQDIIYVKRTAAILRDAPDGEKVMQLPYGTKLKVAAIKEAWYKVIIGSDLAQGYIHESVISTEELTNTDYDITKINNLELLNNGFEDMHVTHEDDAPEAYYTPTLYRELNEGLERMLYWNYKSPSVKMAIYNMDVMVERTKQGTYSETSCKIFNQSDIYKILPKAYINEPATKPTLREIAKPKVSKSFFNEKPQNFLITDVETEDGDIRLRFAKSTLIHLFKIYFTDDNTFKLSKNNGVYTYASQRRIRFFSTDEHGNNVIKNRGQLTYYPGQRSTLVISNLETPLNDKMKLLYFADYNSVDTHLKNKITITPTKQTINGWFELKVFEFDFNSDSVVDMLRSFEDCPEEAGGSSDEVYYFNVNGEWKSVLARRFWCIP